MEIRPLVNEQLDAFCPKTITPPPDHLLRLWFLFTPTNRMTTLPAPTMPFFDRTGFVATEWGGAIVEERQKLQSLQDAGVWSAPSQTE